MEFSRTDIFISATSADFAPMREIMKQAILDLGAHPVEQEHFASDGKAVAVMLRKKIAACHAVIHLVGECSGAEDESAPGAREHRTCAEGRRSYTQLEHDLAEDLGKPIYSFLCVEDFPYSAHDPEPDERRALQVEYRAHLAIGGAVLHRIKHPDDLHVRILSLADPPRSITGNLKAGRAQPQRLVFWVVLVLIWLIQFSYFRWHSRKLHAESLPSEQARFDAMEKREPDGMSLVRAVLAKAQTHQIEGGAAAEFAALNAARSEVAKERPLTLEELAQKLAAAKGAAEDRAIVARRVKFRHETDLETANRIEQAALKWLGDATRANFKLGDKVAEYAR
jgi:hypothetical protein